MSCEVILRAGDNHLNCAVICVIDFSIYIPPNVIGSGFQVQGFPLKAGFKGYKKPMFKCLISIMFIRRFHPLGGIKTAFRSR